MVPPVSDRAEAGSAHMQEFICSKVTVASLVMSEGSRKRSHGKNGDPVLSKSAIHVEMCDLCVCIQVHTCKAMYEFTSHALARFTCQFI